MPADVSFPAGLLYGFLLVLARVSGALAFVPLPGIKGSPGPARVVFSVALGLCLSARWPAVDAARQNPMPYSLKSFATIASASRD